MLSGIKDIPLFDKIIFWMFGFFTVADGKIEKVEGL
jgi:hypothetical protein